MSWVHGVGSDEAKAFEGGGKGKLERGRCAASEWVRARQQVILFSQAFPFNRRDPPACLDLRPCAESANDKRK